MASRCRSSSSLPWLLFLVLVLGGDAVAATSRPLLGIAEPPTTTAARGTAAAGPAGASSRPRGGGRPDRSEAGAEVILAGFAAALIVAIFCYIRVTRKNSSSGSSDVGVGFGSGGKQQGL